MSCLSMFDHFVGFSRKGLRFCKIVGADIDFFIWMVTLEEASIFSKFLLCFLHVSYIKVND